MAQQLSDILASLNSVYDPQKQLVQQQQAALPAQQQAEQAGLDQAKTNAFSDITDAANSRGMVYSGVPVSEQAKYTGATYLPAVANLNNTYANKGFQLQQALLGLNADQQKQAQGTYDEQVAADQDAAAKVQAAQIAAQSKAATAASTTKAPTKTEQQAQFNTLLSQAFQGYDPKNKAQNFYTEKAVIPYLVAQTGLPADQVASQVYSYRKAAFGE